MRHTLTLSLCVLLWAQDLSAHKLPPALHHQKVNKPLLFKALPEVIECGSADLEKLFALAVDEQFSIQLSGQFHLKGKVVAKNQQNAGTFSINVRAENYDNALFNLSVRLLADNNVTIQGRMIHPRYGDVLVLSREKNKYYFRKRSQSLFMPE